MTPEETFNSQVWEILQRIKEESLATELNKPVKYKFGHVVGAGIIPRERKTNILFKLEEWGALKVRDDPFEPPIPADDEVYLDLIQPKFDEVYKQYNPTAVPESANKTVGEFTNDLKLLQDHYQAIKDYPEREFFLGLADYVKMIVETPGLDAVADLINSQLKDDEKKLLSLGAEVRDEIGKTEGEVFNLIAENKISSAQLQKAIDNYKGIRDGQILSSAQIEEALWGEMADILRVLKESGQGDLFKKYIITNNEGGIVSFKISSRYSGYKEELDRYTDLREKTVWGSWNDLILVYLTVHDFEGELKRIDQEKDVWRRMNFIGLHGEMQEIISKQPGDRIEFIREAYKLHLDRVHRFAVEKLFPMYPVIQSVMERVSEYKLDPTFLQAPAHYIGNLKDAVGTIQSFSNSITSAIGSIQNVVGTVRAYDQYFQNIAGAVSSFGSLPSINFPVQGLSNFGEVGWRGEVITRLGSIEEQLSKATIQPTAQREHDHKEGVEKSEVITAGKLNYSFKKCELSYDGGQGIDAPLDNKEMKFFLSLHKKKGEVVDYKDLCRDADTGWYKEESEQGKISHGDLDNTAFSQDAGYLKRDFRDLVLLTGMPEEEFKGLIKTITRRGYKLLS